MSFHDVAVKLTKAGACAVAILFSTSVTVTMAEPLAVEKDELKLGFIKLTDMAPLDAGTLDRWSLRIHGR